jgi:RES domain-containing protein
VIVWRITSAYQALDKSCAGTRQYGGRWNPPGYPALYAAATIELCALEKYVHILGEPPAPLVLVAVELPDEVDLIRRTSIHELPADWAAVPVNAASQEFGRIWLAGAKQLVILLPSAIIPEATVAMINPAHPAYGRVALSYVRAFTFDPRLYGRVKTDVQTIDTGRSLVRLHSFPHALHVLPRERLREKISPCALRCVARGHR